MDTGHRDTITLHHEPDRLETYRALGPHHFDADMNCLCVFDPVIIDAVFRSDKFRVVSFADHYRLISDRTSVDFDDAISALDHIPLANEGERHKRLRAAMAGVIGIDAREKIRAVEAFVAALAERLLQPGSEIELSADLARPIFMRLFSVWLEVDHGDFIDEHNFSQVFDMAMSLNRRKKINRSIGALRCAFQERAGRIPASPEIAVAMNILGNDALTGSITLSLWQTLARHPGSRLCDVPFASNLPSTGVPYIERIALQDVDIQGMRVAKDQRVRLFLDATAFHVSGHESDLLFGRGRHLCIGKPMTLAIWRTLVRVLGASALRATAGEMKLRGGDYAFSYPEHAYVSIHA